MKRLIPLLIAGLTTVCAVAQEKVELPLTVGRLATRDGKIYEGATIVGEDAVGVKVQHEGGTARVMYAKLPADLAKKFAVSAAEGKAQQEEEAKRLKEEAAAKAAQGGDKDKDKEKDDADGLATAPLPTAPEGDGDALAKIASLQAYIAKLNKGILESTAQAAKYRARASELSSTASYTVKGADGAFYDLQNKSKLAKARSAMKQADREDAKILEAQNLILAADRKIQGLRESIANK